MKLRNTTPYPDRFIRRMVAWCCRQLEFPVRKLTEASFSNRSDGFASGRCWRCRRIHVSLGSIVVLGGHDGKTTRITTFPECLNYPTHLDDLVRVTSHELFHAWAFYAGVRTRRNGKGIGSSERDTRWHEQYVLERFRENRDRLIADWCRGLLEPKVPVQRRSRKEQNCRKAMRSLERWQRKLKLAQSKVRLGVVAALRASTVEIGKGVQGE